MQFLYDRNQQDTNISSSITGDYDMMKFAIKGSDADWNNALKGQDVGSTGVVQIESYVSGKVKRKLNQEDIDKEAGIAPKKSKKKKRGKQSKK